MEEILKLQKLEDKNSEKLNGLATIRVTVNSTMSVFCKK
ncbi:class III lanthipeptide [Staphylococcus hominis]|nr:class III lanthipeptide [Staphylococcus hominis]